MYLFQKQNFPWEYDSLERRYWQLYFRLVDSVEVGEINSLEDPEVVAYREEAYYELDDVSPEDSATRLVKPNDVIAWAYQNSVEVPAEIEKLCEVPRKKNPGKAEKAREKRDATFAAALVLIEQRGIKNFQHERSGRLNLKRLGEAIHRHQSKLFEPGVTPLSVDVFSRQFREMSEHYVGALTITEEN